MPKSKKKNFDGKKHKSNRKNKPHKPPKYDGAAGSSNMLTSFVETCRRSVGCTKGNTSDDGTPERVAIDRLTEGTKNGNNDGGRGATSRPNDEELLRQQALAKLRQKTTNDDSEAYDDQDTVEAEEGSDDYVFFWKNQDICSQWHKSSFKVNGQKFVCAEQFMMYKKAELFEDEEAAILVLQTSDPAKMKKIGRQVKGFSAELWEKNCLQIVKAGNMAKFKQNRKLKEELFHTYPKVLVEGSPYDRIWGIGLLGSNPLAWKQETWDGTNYLGFIITEVRDELMCEEKHINPEHKQTYVAKLMEDIERKWFEGSSVDPVSPPTASVATEDPYELAQEQYVYFWQERDKLSQWHESFFELEATFFTCAEQYMMYKKAETFGNEYIQQQIMEAGHPRYMKALGRQLNGFGHRKWQHQCLDVVKRGSIEKFRQNHDLKKYLFSTYPKVLVEASPYDKKWGIGLDRHDPRAWDEKTWQGTNFLGYVLTEVRDELMWQDKKIEEHNRKIYIPLLKVAHCGPAYVDDVNHYTSEASGNTAYTEEGPADATHEFDYTPDQLTDVNPEPEGDSVLTKSDQYEGMTDQRTNHTQVTADVEDYSSANTLENSKQETQTCNNIGDNATNITENEIRQRAEQHDINKDRIDIAEANKYKQSADDDLTDDKVSGRENRTNDVMTDQGENQGEVEAGNIYSQDQVEPEPNTGIGNMQIIKDVGNMEDAQDNGKVTLSADQNDCKTQIETASGQTSGMLDNDDKHADAVETKDSSNEVEALSREGTNCQAQNETETGQNSRLAEMHENNDKPAYAAETKDASKYFKLP